MKRSADRPGKHARPLLLRPSFWIGVGIGAVLACVVWINQWEYVDNLPQTFDMWGHPHGASRCRLNRFTGTQQFYYKDLGWMNRQLTYIDHGW